MTESTLSSEAGNVSMVKERKVFAFHSLPLHRIVNEIRDDCDGVNLKTALCVAFAGFL